MIITDQQAEVQGLKIIAELMCVAARTAPKACGIDNIVTAIIEGEDKDKLAACMWQIGNEYKNTTFKRDAECVEKIPLVMLIGTRIESIGLKLCGLCGWKDCAEAIEKKAICIFNPGDLGIAVGSAVSIAANHRADNRVFYTAGFAAVQLKLLGESVQIAYGIPLSVTGKNPFFDRK